MRANSSAGRVAEPPPAPPASPDAGEHREDAPPYPAAGLPALGPGGAAQSEPAARNLLAAAGVLLFYAALCLLYFRSLAGTLGDRILGLSGDPVFNLYVLKWSAHQLSIGLPGLWDANFFYPARGVLAFSDHLLGPAAQLLALLGLGAVPSAVAGYNLLLLSSFFLSAATTAWVLRQSGRSWTAAALGGAMFAFAPLRWAHLDHIQILLWPGLGFALGCGAWLLARRRWGGNWPLRGAAMDPWERGLALGGALCFLLSFPLVFVPLSRVVPGLAHLRAPGRFHAMTAIAVAAFAAKGVDAILPTRGGRRLAVGVCLALFLALESMPVGVDSRPLRDTPDFPAAYRYLGSAGGVHAVLELPRLRPARESLYMYYSTVHWQPIANGYSGFIPASDAELRASIPLLPDGRGFALLRQLGISHLVLHTQGLQGRPIRQRLDAWEAQFLHREVERVFESEGDLVYVLTGGG
jgi:hypothetical protein